MTMPTELIQTLRMNPYGYLPTKYVCILFVVLFAISTVIHLGQAIRYRLWWLLPTACLCGALEIVGWIGRAWSSRSPLKFPPYEMQIICTIMGPTPLAAANFIILGYIITRLGSQYSRLSARTYAILFLCCDFISLVIQGIGGGMAARAVAKHINPEKGGHVMLAGIIFQLITITVYAFCAGEFVFRYARSKPISASPAVAKQERPILTQRMKILLYALALSTTLLLIRAVYRVCELADGWTGRIIHTQVYFNVLDGAAIVLAMYTLNFVHPGMFLELRSSRRSEKIEMESELDAGEKV
ncbi:RTA1-like protein [Roridomyces roridus]|uniref:RTA1-like protein n=1 Tax=Roridomyces roridus TaxID=1738132 RepID=A0AAD7FCM3_9AGAR|nr:RTA1-like protein [Roridomyces roridus]